MGAIVYNPFQIAPTDCFAIVQFSKENRLSCLFSKLYLCEVFYVSSMLLKTCRVKAWLASNFFQVLAEITLWCACIRKIKFCLENPCF